MKKGPPQRINRGKVRANCVEAFESFGVEPLPSEGKGHTFESCRVRHFFFILQRCMRAPEKTPALAHSSE